jgi:hypothetical protein
MKKKPSAKSRMHADLKMTIAEINPAYRQTLIDIGKNKLGLRVATPNRVLKALYQDLLLKPAMSEFKSNRTSEHPALTVDTPHGEAKIRLKGGIYVYPGAPIAKSVEYTNRAVEQEIKQSIPKNVYFNYPTGPTGFYVKPLASHYYRIGKKIAEKCPETIINTPIAMVEFPKLKVLDKSGHAFTCAAVIEAKKPLSYRVSELQTRDPEEAWLFMANTMINQTKDFKRGEWIYYKATVKKSLSEMKGEARAELLKKETPRMFKEFREKLLKNARDNMSTIYKETGYLPLKLGIEDNVDTLGRFADYDFFEKLSQPDAEKRIDLVVKELDIALDSVKKRLRF